jgi:hypothetical protein
MAWLIVFKEYNQNYTMIDYEEENIKHERKKYSGDQMSR